MEEEMIFATEEEQEIEDGLDNGGLDSAEAGFMYGYIDSGIDEEL